MTQHPQENKVNQYNIIDTDIHNVVPGLDTLLPYMPSHWREYFTNSRFNGPVDQTYPAGAETSIQPGLAKTAATTLTDLQQNILDKNSIDIGILNCSYEVDSLHNPDMATACARAVNQWQAERWLEEDGRLRASIVVPSKVPSLAVKEIERWANHPGFVQIFLPVRSQHLYGTRNFWPVLETAVKHNLALCIHYGGASGYPSTPTGWPSWHIEEYVGMAQVFQSQIINLIIEGVFTQFPEIRFVMAEGGWTWLPSLMWRLDKEWKGLRFEIPWVKTFPSDLIRKHMRFTLQPTDAPPEPDLLNQTIEHLESDDLLMYSSDYPHWHDSAEKLLETLSIEQKNKILFENAQAFYGF
ncbi:MAG: amidohydrolase family protein [Chloroflexota bacterium]